MDECRHGVLAVTMGEPAGIGGEITMLAWQSRHSGLPPFVVVDDPSRLTQLAQVLGWSVPIEPVADVDQAQRIFGSALPVLEIALPAAVDPGRPDPRNASAVVDSIDRCFDLVHRGAATAMVTNPISKHVLVQSGFKHLGHTDYLAHLSNCDRHVAMMLASPNLRVVPVTVHLPLAHVPAALTAELIVQHCQLTVEALRVDFGIPDPKIVVAALNPHGGESGDLGREEIEVIQPAVDQAHAAGIDVTGPMPADSLFHAKARSRFDAVICMFHDQALIPLKTIDFDSGVNVTIGLPFVRTSPDHGTAFDIAGTGRASPRSMIEALRLAAAMAQRRAACGVGAHRIGEP